MLVVVGLAPLIFGSNNASTQMVETFLIAVVALLYITLSGNSLPAGWWQPTAVAVLSVLTLMYVAFQLLPLGLEGRSVNGLAAPGTISIAPGDTWIGLINLCGFALFALLVRFASRHEKRRMFLFSSAFVLVALYAVLGLALLRMGDTLLFIEKTAYRGVTTATFVNRNSYATFLSMGFVVGLAWLGGRFGRLATPQPAGSRWSTALAVVGLLAILASLIATNSRMGLVACAAGTVMVFVLWVTSSARGVLSIVLPLVAAAVAASVLFVTLGTGLVTRLISTEDDFGQRLELYRQVARMIEARPITGFGLEAFEVAFPLFHQLPLAIDSTIRNAHSTYLALWTELGLVAGTLPMLIFGLCLIGAVARALRPHPGWPIAAAGAGAMVVAAVHSTVDFSLEIQANVYFLIFVVMLLPPRDDRRAAKAEPEPSRQPSV
ncbi:O-antigen ligase family protein [Devosia sp. CN2-171]|uniref:O-antigen ligase family protein n=1 Tax=Devosia sp. CN2-171 TaxID=3400909 RepID=UPI003BF7F9AC